jgi:hypothetical protein
MKFLTSTLRRRPFIHLPLAWGRRISRSAEYRQVWTTTCSPGPSRTLRLDVALTCTGSSPMNGKISRYHYKVCEDALLISRDRYHWHTYHIHFYCCMQRRMRPRCDVLCSLCPCYNDFQISQRPTPFRAATIVLLNCFFAASHRRCLVTR